MILLKGIPMRFCLFAAAVLVATGTMAQTVPAEPQANPRGAETRAKLLAADANRDGQWDKTEWLAAGRRERGFGFLDADSNGLVTQDELKAGMAKMKAKRAN